MSTLYSAGTCSQYRLGRPISNNSNRYPTQVPIKLDGMVCIAAGWQHNVIVYQDGTVFGWGSNSDGQLGLPQRNNDNHPVQITSLANQKVVWAACGDKVTAFLTDNGDVYVSCKKSPQYQPYRVNIPVPCVYCACATSCVYCIGEDGAIYKIQEDPTNSIEKYVLPSQAYDVAAGENFAIAVTVDHVAYGLGKLGDSHFVPIPSLHDINVCRVFAYNQHAAIVSAEGRVYTWGSGGNGRLGHGDEENQDRFKLVEALKNKKIVDVDMGDSHTIFITSDGHVYSCGASDDGRLMLGENQPHSTPTLSTAISDHAIYATCGCFHSYVLCGTTPIVHPGVKTFISFLFDTQDSPIQIGQYSVSINPHAFLAIGLYPGDIVKTQEFTGVLIGSIDESNALLLVNNEYKSVPQNQLLLVSRHGYVGIPVLYENNKLFIDGGDILKSFGLRLNEVLSNDSGNLCKVVGVFGSQLFVSIRSEDQNENLPTVNSLNLTLRELFSTYTLAETKRDIVPIEIGDVTYPCEKIEPFFLHKMEPIEIFATFAYYYVGKKENNQSIFLKQSDVSEIETNGTFYAYDTVLYGKHRGYILSVGKEQSVIATEDINSKKGVTIVPNSELTLLTRVIPGAKVTKEIDGKDTELSISLPFAHANAIRCLPSDIYVGKQGYVVVIGFLDETEGFIGTPYACLLDDLLDMKDTFKKPFKFDPSEYTLLRRIYPLSECTTVYNSVEIPIIIPTSQSSMLNTGLLQGDEILFNETKAIVLGVSNNYLWLKTFDGEFITQVIDPTLEKEIKISRRPATNYQLLL